MSQSPDEKGNRGAKKSAISYIVILFLFAFLFLFVSLLMQQRTSEEAISELTNSLSAMAPLEMLIEENQTLSASLADAQDELEDKTSQLLQAEADLSIAEKASQALDWLVAIQSLALSGDKDGAAAMLTSFQATELPLYLSTTVEHSDFSDSLLSPAQQYQELLLALQ